MIRANQRVQITKKKVNPNRSNEVKGNKRMTEDWTRFDLKITGPYGVKYICIGYPPSKVSRDQMSVLNIHVRLSVYVYRPPITSSSFPTGTSMECGGGRRNEYHDESMQSCNRTSRSHKIPNTDSVRTLNQHIYCLDFQGSYTLSLLSTIHKTFYVFVSVKKKYEELPEERRDGHISSVLS